MEAISEILGRVAPGGTSVEPAFELIEEGLAARPDLSAPVTVRAYLPARDAGAASAAAAAVASSLTIDDAATAVPQLLHAWVPA